MKNKILSRITILLFLSLATLFVIPVKTFAATCDWTGASSANWNDSGNWTGSCSGVGIPGNGDSLNFPDATSNRDMVNDISGLTVTSLDFTGFNAYTLTGNAISISSSIQENFAFPFFTLDIDVPMTLTGDVTIQTNHTSMFHGNIDLNGHDLNITPNGNSISISGNISGTGNLVGSAGTTFLSGNNTFTGNITLGANCSFSLQSNTAAGNSSNLISSTENNSAIDLGNVGTIPNNISFTQGSFISSSASNNTLSGNITVGTSLQVSSDISSSNHLNLTGVISGSGNIKKTGSGIVTIGGSSSNTFTGTFTTTESPTYLDKTSPAVAIPGTAIIGNGTNGPESILLILNQDSQIGGNVQTASDGKFDLNGHNATVSGLTGNGVVNIPTGSQLSLQNSSSTTTAFDGIIKGAGEITKSGGATQSLNGNSSTFTGSLNLVDEGSIEVDGDMSSTSLTITEGVVLGVGTLKDLNIVSGSTGTLSPGHTGVGTLTFVDSVTLNSEITFSSILIGTTAGTEYGQIQTGGDINLGNATLAVNPSFVPNPGDQFILAHTSGGTINGTFAGHPNFTTFILGPREYLIEYTSDEVKLTVVATLFNPSFVASPTSPIAGNPFTVTSTWTGTADVPTGTAELFDGSTSLGSVALASGIATFNVSGLSAGTHLLHVVYSGDGTYNGAISNNLTLQVQVLVTPTPTPVPTSTPTPIIPVVEVTPIVTITTTPKPTEQPVVTIAPSPTPVIELKTTFNVTVVIKDINGNPIKSAYVILEPGKFSGYTDEFGGIKFQYLPKGEYTIKVEYGNTSISQKISVSKDDTTTIKLDVVKEATEVNWLFIFVLLLMLIAVLGIGYFIYRKSASQRR